MDPFLHVYSNVAYMTMVVELLLPSLKVCLRREKEECEDMVDTIEMFESMAKKGALPQVVVEA